MVAVEIDVYLSLLSSSFKIVPFPENTFFKLMLSIQYCEASSTSIYNIFTPNDLKTDLTNDRAATWREIKHWKSRLVLFARFPVLTWHCTRCLSLTESAYQATSTGPVRCRHRWHWIFAATDCFRFSVNKGTDSRLFGTNTSQASTSFQCVCSPERLGTRERPVEPQ